MDRETIQSISIPPGTTIKDSIRRLNDTARKILFVADADDKLVGTISDGDIRRGLIAGYGFNEPVEKIMCKDFFAFDYADLHAKARAREVMVDRNIQLIPLIDQHGRVRDVILWTDILGVSNTKKTRQVHDNKVIIMAGGKGTRLDIFTKIFPKSLIPVGDKPAVELIMERFYNHGFHRFIYTLNHKKEYVKLFLKERTFPYEIDWVEEQEFLGTAGSLSLVREKIDDTFFVINCDTLLDIDYAEVLAWHKERGAALTAVGCHNEISIPFGVLSLANGKLEKIHEKPSHDVIVNTGMYVMEPRALAYLIPGQPTGMNELINAVISKEDVNVYPVYGRDWLDLGQWDSYKRSTKILEQNGYV